jgi:hypothetical protein
MQAINPIFGNGNTNQTIKITKPKEKSLDKKTTDFNVEIYDFGLFKKEKENINNQFISEVTELNIFSKGMEYVSIEQGNNVSTDDKPLIKKAGAIMTLPPFYTESFALAKEQVKTNAVDDLKTLGPIALVFHLLSVWFGVSFFVILFFIFVVAAFEFIFSLIKRFKLDGVDYSPIAKVQVLGGAFLLFTFLSFVQVAFDYILITEYNIPEWAKSLTPYANLRNLSAIGILLFYANTVRKMFLKGAGAAADEIAPFQVDNNNGQQ